MVAKDETMIIPKVPVVKKKTAVVNLEAPGKSKPAKSANPIPLLQVSLSMTVDTLAFEPSRKEVLHKFKVMLKSFQTAVIGLRCLLLDDRFKFVTAPIIAGRPSNFQLGEGVNLKAVFSHDSALAAQIATIDRLVNRSYDAVESYVDILAPFVDMYRENENLDLEALRTGDHTPKFFNTSLAKYKNMYSVGNTILPLVENGVFMLDSAPFKDVLLPSPKRCLEVVEEMLPLLAAKRNKEIGDRVNVAMSHLDKVAETTIEHVEGLNFMNTVEGTLAKLEEDTLVVGELFDLIERFELTEMCQPEDAAEHAQLKNFMTKFNDKVKVELDDVPTKMEALTDSIDKDISALGAEVLDVRTRSEAPIVFDPEAKLDEAKSYTDNLFSEMETMQSRAQTLKGYQRTFRIEVTKFNALEETHAEVRAKKTMWEAVDEWDKFNVKYGTMPFLSIDADEMNNAVQQKFKQAYSLTKSLPDNEVVPKLQVEIEKMKAKMPVIVDMRNPNLKQRHWDAINEIVKSEIPHDDQFTLGLLDSLDAFQFAEDLQAVGGNASSEAALDTMMTKLELAWKDMEFPVIAYRESKDVFILGGLDEIQAQLDDSLVNIGTIAGSRHSKPIAGRVEDMQRSLGLFSETLDEWIECQRSWTYLESIFSAPDIQRQLPAEAKMFLEVDKSFKDAMRKTQAFPVALRAGCTPGFLDLFKHNNELLGKIQKCLEDYLESKRAVFSRFYFLSNDELLEILSQTRNPQAVQPHMQKCFDMIKKLDFEKAPPNPEDGSPAFTNDILAMVCPKGEYVSLGKGLKARGNVESWLGGVEDAMVKSLKALSKASILDYAATERTQWAQNHCSQVIIMVSQIYWAKNTIAALDGGNVRGDLTKYESELKQNLADLAKLARDPQLPKMFRRVLGALITIDVHSRDNITGMLAADCKDQSAFEWTKQLRYYWDDELDTCVVKMSNAVVYYSYEYLGADMRLVITPLTDRCYLCLLGAVALDLGGAPAGPAGTGKTETTKDLAKAIGIQCVVFNCSDQMDFRMTGRFFAGLAQSGAWCCFDEFNRIDIEVLSVIAQQILTIRDAKIARKTRFQFEGREIGLIRTCAAFITMNPGYAGRTELPDNLKALFRPQSMMVPNYAMIAEVILYSEGFEDPQSLSQKMVQMFKLCSEQLSQQDHYDFGMRAVKSVLVMAGGLKRERVGQSEAQVLLTALRDSNLPKFLSDDAVLFRAILSDLFPGIKLESHDYGTLQTTIEDCCAAKGLIDNNIQVGKIIQFYETMVVRHGLMLVGPTGGGKTTVFEVLKDALTSLGEQGEDHADYKKVNSYVMNPKAVSMGELYGEVNPITSEWKDGLMAMTVRHCVQAAEDAEDHQWIMCDGPVDALWIENMNTVLDDNKMLCMANSERIKLSAWMHMVFEVQDLAVASPATVSRCGMVYIDPTDLGWKPYFQRWLRDLDAKVCEEMKAYINTFVDEHFDPIMYHIRKYYGTIMEQVDMGKVSAFTTMFEQLLVGPNAEVDLTYNDETAETVKQTVASCMFFSMIWGLSGNLHPRFYEKFDEYIRAKIEDYREIKLPGLGQVYDYYLNFSVSPPAFTKWDEIVPKFNYDTKMAFFDMLVPTATTVKYSYLLGKYLDANHSVLFTGETGVGKSVIAKSALDKLQVDTGVIIPITINFSAQTSSLRTQEMIELKLVKKRKTILGAPNGKKIILFIDDLNMPALDTYGSQPPIELLRQYQDFRGMYDRDKFFWKDINDVTLTAACAPPGGGRNQVTPRFIRHFAMLGVPPPDGGALKTIFTQILNGFFVEQGFNKEVQGTGNSIVAAGVEIYERMAQELLPTPAKSHYVFNLRDLSKVVQGILMTDSASIRVANDAYDSFMHESQRVFHDRLINLEDKAYYNNMLSELSSKHFRRTIDAEELVSDPIIFGDWMKIGAEGADRTYERLELKKIPEILEEYLDNYNMDSTKEMTLVFFRDAVEHVSRVARILAQPRGNALLVGVGGCGKQSLTRMAAVMLGMNCIQIEITRGYGSSEFHEDLKLLFDSAGTKGKPTVFLFTDTQIVEESFLEDINNILNSGEVPNLFEPEEIEKFIGPLRGAAKEAGCDETRDAVFRYFIDQVRANLHLVICMSPVGDSFRSRCRMFPSLVNCCTIDWYTEWPAEALGDVSARKFEFVDLGGDKMKAAIAEMCVVVHTSVQSMAERFYDELRRKYYTTPTSYLELITLYCTMLEKKRRELILAKDRYANGLKKLTETDALIGTMQIELTALEPVLKESAKATAELMVKVKEDEAEAAKVKAVVSVDEAVAKKKASETEAIQADAQRDLDQALPALSAAQKALDSLEKKDIQEVKAFATPPDLVQTVMEAVCVLFNRKQDWKSAKLLLGESDFMKSMVDYDKDNISDKHLKKLKPYIDNEKFQPDIVANTSRACKSLCMWVRAMDLYAHVFRTVEPKRAKLKEAEQTLSGVMSNLKMKQDQLKEVETKIAALQKQFKESVAKKKKLEDNMALTTARLDRAGILQDSLGSEKVRWKELVGEYDIQLVDCVGNVFLASACVAYFGAFSSTYRTALVKIWSDKCEELGVPHTKGMGLAEILSNPYQIRGWNASQLPSDQLSIENAVLVTQGRRWPLMIDPQDQANTWIRTMERPNGLQIVKLTTPNFLRTLENAIRTGAPVLLEEVGETLDPSLEPILLKQTFKQGGRLLIRLGDSDVDYNQDFRFYMTSKLGNPHYLPEICIKVTIINFTVTKSGLEDQLLVDTVQLERPDLEEQRTKLIMAINEDKESLKTLEDKILKLLFEAEGNILDDKVLIETLRESKVVSTAIGERLVEAEKTDAQITEAREKYRSVATRGSIVFFVIADMGLVDSMYQYSLAYFKNLFNLCIRESDKSDDLPTRLASIIEFSTKNIYTNIARGLFEKHKLVFSAMLCTEILRPTGAIDPAAFGYFLRGAGAGDRERPERPECAWLKEATWKAVFDLETDVNAIFAGVALDFAKAPMVLTINGKSFCINENEAWTPPEACAEAAGLDWDAKLSNFEKVTLITTARSEFFSEAASAYVAAHLGQAFVESPAIDLDVVYKDLNNITPLIFVLSAGSDPMADFQRFAKRQNFGDKYMAISLGQGQGPIAERMVAEANKKGTWVFLQNCHLCKSWMEGMAIMVKDFALPDANIHPDFRLYLSSAPCDFFPIGVLQNSVKITNEPPKGLRANVRASFAGLDKADFEGHVMGDTYRRLIFGLCFFHANVLERKKFGPLGWNIRYDFSTTDLETTLDNLKMFLDELGNVPWDALTYLIGEIYYGGRVTDAWDERTLRTVLKSFFTIKSLDKDYTYSESGVYRPLSFSTIADYVTHIEAKFPFSDDPDIFGLHQNANIQFQMDECSSTLGLINSVQPRTAAGAGAKSPDELVFEVAEMIQGKIRDNIIDIDQALEGMFDRDEEGQIASMSTVLKQEIERFNTMLKVLWRILVNIKKAIKGLVVMSLELELVYKAFLNNEVPPVWVAAAYPSLRPLGSWVNDLVLRLAFIEDWLLNGAPPSFWISGFYFPQGFLTGTLQTHARKYQAPIDKLSFKFTVYPIHIDPAKSFDGIKFPATEDGVLVHGVFMDACRWDLDAGLLVDSLPGEMRSELPMMHMLPSMDFVPPKNDYIAPVYKTSVRAGMLSTTGHSTNFVVPAHLPSAQTPDYWVRKGAALLTQLDD